MSTIRRAVALLSLVVVCATACEIPIEDTGAPDDQPSPWATVPPPASSTTVPGVERNVDPAPTTSVTTTTTAPASNGLTLVAQTKGSDEVFELDGARVGAAFDARLVVEDNRVIDHVTWRFDDTLFRDDDLLAPYTLRYADAAFPIDKWMPSDQGLPGRFRAATGSMVELTATVHAAGTTEQVTASFTVGDAPASVVTTTSAPATAPTTAAPVTTAPPTTTAAPVPTTTAAPLATANPSGAPWSIAGGQAVNVTLPQGQLGPRTATAVDPATVPGISYSNGVWKMSRDWDETRDGGYLDFGAAALRPNGHRVLGFRIEVPANISSGHVIDGGGEIGHFEITNPHQRAHNSFIRDGIHAHHYIARGVVGDAIKVGQGSAHHHDAYIEMNVLPGGPNDKHYDGAQIFKSGSARLERIVIDWNDAGTIANTTAAFFTHDSAAFFARDLLVLNPGGTWQPLRLYGSGGHDVDRVQLIGARRPNNISGKLAPTAAVQLANGSATFTLWNGVSGTDDWLIE